MRKNIRNQKLKKSNNLLKACKFFLCSICTISFFTACSNTLQNFEDELQKMHGLSENACIGTFGPPTQKRYTDHEVILTWRHREPAKVGTKGGYVSHGIDKETGKPIDFEPRKDKDHVCVLKITLDGGKVVHHAFSGDRRGCDPLIEKAREKFGTNTFAFPD